jgi:hypothetical protein
MGHSPLIRAFSRDTMRICMCLHTQIFLKTMMEDQCFCAISGTVFVDRPGSGILHPTDVYAGVMAVHLMVGGKTILDSTTTDECGNYYFGIHLLPGVCTCAPSILAVRFVGSQETINIRCILFLRPDSSSVPNWNCRRTTTMVSRLWRDLAATRRCLTSSPRTLPCETSTQDWCHVCVSLFFGCPHIICLSPSGNIDRRGAEGRFHDTTNVPGSTYRLALDGQD